eukprot:NODE_5458_length_651_cov_34.057252_g5294_i0.p1 GENE.NODE_5458_length_651_cov_34.057252_g5294_i0~~NODE_5458_length_651_cov_34.057252_g5294_i0.p1  ORF type:complete len:181 (+),score=58.02 NODE_5458_length_651_cov_34.057252_g5294_i0:60-545(+)
MQLLLFLVCLVLLTSATPASGPGPLGSVDDVVDDVVQDRDDVVPYVADNVVDNTVDNVVKPDDVEEFIDDVVPDDGDSVIDDVAGDDDDDATGDDVDDIVDDVGEKGIVDLVGGESATQAAPVQLLSLTFIGIALGAFGMMAYLRVKERTAPMLSERFELL